MSCRWFGPCQRTESHCNDSQAGRPRSHERLQSEGPLPQTASNRAKVVLQAPVHDMLCRAHCSTIRIRNSWILHHCLQVYLTLESEAKRELQTLQSQLEAVKQVFASVQKQAFASGGVVRCEAMGSTSSSKWFAWQLLQQSRCCSGWTLPVTRCSLGLSCTDALCLTLYHSNDRRPGVSKADALLWSALQLWRWANGGEQSYHGDVPQDCGAQGGPCRFERWSWAAARQDTCCGALTILSLDPGTWRLRSCWTACSIICLHGHYPEPELL